MRRPLLAAMAAAAAQGASAASDGLSIAAFGGVMTDERWLEILSDPVDVDTNGGRLAGVAAAVELARPLDAASLELEAQLARHWGEQDLWELNAPVLRARWTAFPWSDRAPTSAAFGLGLSAASETPPIEVRLKGDSRPVMAHWHIEVAAGPPNSEWEALVRLQHRSTAFGLFGDDGGSDGLVAGLRRRF